MAIPTQTKMESPADQIKALIDKIDDPETLDEICQYAEDKMSELDDSESDDSEKAPVKFPTEEEDMDKN